MNETRTRITQVGRGVVPVTDQDRAIEFYDEKLGFEKRADIPYGNSDRWVEVGPPGGEAALALVPPLPGNPVGVKTGVILVSLDIEADHADLRERGVDVDAEISHFGDPV